MSITSFRFSFSCPETQALHRDGSSHGAQGPTQTAQSVTMEQRPPLAGKSLL